MAKKRGNQGGAHRANGNSSSGASQRPVNSATAASNGNGTNGSKGATATAARPAVKSSTANGANGTAPQSQSDRIAAARQRNAAARAAADRRRSMQGGWLRRQWPLVATVVTVVLLIGVFFAIAHNASSGSASIGNPVPQCAQPGHRRQPNDLRQGRQRLGCQPIQGGAGQSARQ